VCLEASTKPPIHNLIHEVLINMVFTMAYPNFKKEMKMAFGPLGVNLHLLVLSLHYFSNCHGASLFYQNVVALAMTCLLEFKNEAYSMNPINLIG
jgi:hypothetical protein